MDKGRFAGRVVQITGAASGFGAAAARAFAAEGALLALSDVQEAALAALADDLSAAFGADCILTDRLDVTRAADHAAHMDRIVARWGRLDVAVNNAGVADALAPLHMISEGQYDRIMQINAKGVFLGMKAQIPLMLAARSGAIVNVASAAGLLGAAQMAAYAASKHAVVGLTRAAADEVARQGVRVNALCPSFAHTPLFTAVADAFGARLGLDAVSTHDRISARIPMRRVATPDEVVQAILWASAPDNTFFTGQTLSIDGGLTAV